MLASESREYWVADHPVLAVLRERRASGSVPADRDDGYKVGLALEGGGMRGIVSAAMLTAIEDQGFHHAFDDVYGASAGAMNAAYFLANETWYPLSIYYDDLASRAFIDFRRMLRGASILDLDLAFDHIVEHRKPLDFAAVLRSQTRLHIAVTDVDALQTVDVTTFADSADLKETLKASSWLPLAVRSTATWRGRRAVDGGTITAHPYTLAARDGCTHVLSLSTRPIAPPRRRHSAAQHFAAWRMNRLRDGLGTAFLAGARASWDERRTLQRQMTEPAPDPYVLDLAPTPDMPEVKRHEIDLGRLLQAARGAYGLTFCALTGTPSGDLAGDAVRVIPRLTVVSQRPVERTGPIGG